MNAFDLHSRSRPFLKWAGGKSASLQALISHFPSSFTRYVEPFLGGGAVLFSLKPEIGSIASDSNAELVETYAVVRDLPNELMGTLDSFTQVYSEKFYYELRSKEPVTKSERAARLIFLNKTGFNGLFRLNSKGQFNVPFGKRKKCPILYDRKNLLNISERLKTIKLKTADFEGTIGRTRYGDFIYCDPPYEPLSPTSAFTSYVKNRFGSSDQLRLKLCLESAVKRGVKVAVSNSTSPYIMDLYSHWTQKRISVRRNINSKGDRRGAIDEMLMLLG